MEDDENEDDNGCCCCCCDCGCGFRNGCAVYRICNAAVELLPQAWILFTICLG